MYQVLEYYKFIFKSSNHHGVHSPFVYHLITKCLYKKTANSLWSSFCKIKHQLANNKEVIKVNDLGPGSKVFKTDERKVSKILKVAGISNKKAKLLINLINYFKPKTVLEIGTSLGLATSAIKIGNKGVKIKTLEGCEETSKIAKKIFINNHFNTIEILTGDFKKTIPEITNNNTYHFIYFDGNHTKKATLDYFKTCLKTMNNNSIWVFDDIYLNKGMKEAWSEIKNNQKVTVTVDIFYLGIVFFRKEQEKEHFKIRV
jgi:predicted O-methyltransferase YrrM